jgi:hypothetical protein
MEELVASVKHQLQAVFAGRAVILAGDVAAAATPKIAVLQALGVPRFLVVAGDRGTGPQPETFGAEVALYPMERHANTIAFFRAEERVFAQPPVDATAALDRFDPDRSALVLGPFFSAATAFGDRPFFGARRPEWVALEDKTRNDELFDANAVARPPSRVVAVDRAAIRAAARELDGGNGTVWSGDARDGFNGGGVFVRWVRNDDDEAEALGFFEPNCDHVRIAPFVEGIPCSIHGFVTGDGVAAFRPVELVTLRSPARPHLVYSGCATYFDPPAADTEAMRGAVRRIGEWLRAHVDFRGAFTLDGILSSSGWVATECNPRYGAALGYVTTARPDLPFILLNYAASEGVVDVAAASLEAVVLAAGRDVRWGGAWTPTRTVVTESTSHDVVFDANGACRRASEGETRDATFWSGSGPLGGFVRLTLAEDRTPHGMSIAPRAAAAFAWADAELHSGLGPLAPALNVR